MATSNAPVAFQLDESSEAGLPSRFYGAPAARRCSDKRRDGVSAAKKSAEEIVMVTSGKNDSGPPSAIIWKYFVE